MNRTEYVGIGEMKISNDAQTALVAPNLGSCVSVAAYDPEAKIGGMIHCLLPMASGHEERAKAQPYAFVDIGVVQFLQKLLAAGAKKDRLVIAVAGGGNINDEGNVFEIGKRNYTVLRKVLWKNNLLIKAEHIGDSHSRTFGLDISSGKVWVKIKGDVLPLVQ